MDFKEFDKYQADIFKECANMASTKGKEYSNSESRFANFDRLSVQLDLKSYQIGWVYLTKHLDSIASYCKNGETYSTETIQGRIVDAIAYLTLIGGMILEEAKGEESKSELLCNHCCKSYKDAAPRCSSLSGLHKFELGEMKR